MRLDTLNQPYTDMEGMKPKFPTAVDGFKTNFHNDLSTASSVSNSTDGGSEAGE